MAKISTSVDFALIELEGPRWDSASHVWNQIRSLKAQLRFLATFFDDDVLQFSLASLLWNMEAVLNLLIIGVAVETGSLSFLIQVRGLMEDKVSDTNLALSTLFEMIKIVKAEAFLIDLLNCKANLMVLAKGRISAFDQGLQFFREFGELILAHIEVVVRLAGSVDNSCFADRINADILFKLFKAEKLFLMVILDDDSTDLMEKDETDKLYEGLLFLREFLSDVLEENLAEVKLKLIEVVASEAASLVFSYCEEEIREDTADKMNGLPSDMLEKIKHVKAEATARHLQVARSSLSNCLKTGRLSFIDFLWGNLMELLTHRADSIAYVDYQFEVLLRELDSFRSSLWENADQHNEHQELKDHASCVTDVAYEAEYVIGLFEVKDGLRCLVLWLFDAIEEIKSMKTRITGFSTGKLCDVEDHNVAKTLNHMKLEANTPTSHEVVVGLDDQEEDIIKQLTRGSMQLDIVINCSACLESERRKLTFHDPSVKMKSMFVHRVVFLKYVKSGRVVA